VSADVLSSEARSFVERLQRELGPERERLPPAPRGRGAEGAVPPLR